MSIGIVASSGQQLSRATAPNIQADYTAMGLIYLNLSGASNQTVFSISELMAATGHRDEIGWSFLSDKFFLNTVGGTGAAGIVNGTNLVTYDAWMKLAIRRLSGTVSLWYSDYGSALTQQASGAAGTSGRSAAANVYLGTETGSGGTIRVEGWRIYEGRGLTDVEMDAELAYWPFSDGTRLWAAWRLQTAGSYSDVTANSRDLAATGTPTTQADQGLLEPPIPIAAPGYPKYSPKKRPVIPATMRQF